jgi:protein translocase SecG subunit
MLSVISLLIIILTLLLIGAILLQPGKGDLSSTFGGIGSQMGSMFGMQRTVTLLAKITKIIAIIILILTLGANKFFISREVEMEKLSTEGAELPKSIPMSEPPVEAPR